MAKLTPEQKLKIYKRTLAGYVANGDPKAPVQARLVASLEADIAKMEAGNV